jgi:hypothetical protein
VGEAYSVVGGARAGLGWRGRGLRAKAVLAGNNEGCRALRQKKNVPSFPVLETDTLACALSSLI